jgi:hypothetical protein
MSIETRYKQPGDVLDFNVDFSKWITEDDVITTIEAVIDPTGAAVIDAVENVNPVVKVWIKGGEDNASYKVTVKVGTSLGRVKETEFRLRIREI